MTTSVLVYYSLIAIFTPVSVGITAAIAWWFINERGDPVSDPDKMKQIWASRDAWGEDICRQLIEGKLSPGMTPEMVRLSWGEPQAKTTGKDGQEHWLYDEESPPRRYVDFANEQVVDVAQTKLGPGISLSPWAVFAITAGLSFLAVVVILVVVFL